MNRAQGGESAPGVVAAVFAGTLAPVACAVLLVVVYAFVPPLRFGFPVVPAALFLAIDLGLVLAVWLGRRREVASAVGFTGGAVLSTLPLLAAWAWWSTRDLVSTS